MTKIYLDLPADVQYSLEENHLSIGEVLAHLGIDQTITYDLLPYQGEYGVRTKELAPVIIAASGLVLAISFAISQIVSTLQRRPYLIEIHEIEEVRDTDDKVVIDNQGQPVVRTIKRFEILEPRAENKEREFELHFDLKQGFVIKVRSEEKQLPEEDAKGVNIEQISEKKSE